MNRHADVTGTRELLLLGMGIPAFVSATCKDYLHVDWGKGINPNPSKHKGFVTKMASEEITSFARTRTHTTG